MKSSILSRVQELEAKLRPKSTTVVRYRWVAYTVPEIPSEGRVRPRIELRGDSRVEWLEGQAEFL